MVHCIVSPHLFGLRKAVAFLPEILTKSADARKMALSMKHVEYGGELLSQLMSCSSKMEKLHEKLNDLVTRNVDDETKYEKLCEIAEKEMKWVDKAKARLQGGWHIHTHVHTYESTYMHASTHPYIHTHNYICLHLPT